MSKRPGEPDDGAGAKRIHFADESIHGPEHLRLVRRLEEMERQNRALKKEIGEKDALLEQYQEADKAIQAPPQIPEPSPEPPQSPPEPTQSPPEPPQSPPEPPQSPPDAPQRRVPNSRRAGAEPPFKPYKNKKRRNNPLKLDDIRDPDAPRITVAVFRRVMAQFVGDRSYPYFEVERGLPPLESPDLNDTHSETIRRIFEMAQRVAEYEGRRQLTRHNVLNQSLLTHHV
ncbi:hypothetical protein HNY73_014237 [Argiope bruennichi]|uniref:Uncharacterized protein n=1 Tax=Argiope bruennichi TaxID=94029 RepID=A0A8T0EPG8_ARGBR|nr:hypothetical protein HNY73_014237 [Argiope bruennichi]